MTIRDHILNAFKGHEYGHFMTVAQICNAITPEYPDQDKRPGRGAILAHLLLSRTLIKSDIYDFVIQYGHKVADDDKSPQGGRKVQP